MKEIDYKAIGARIKYYRNQRNITQAQLAETSSVEPSISPILNEEQQRSACRLYSKLQML